MNSVKSGKSRRGRIGSAAALMLGLAIAGCSGNRIFGGSDGPAATGSTTSSPSFGDRVSKLFNKPSVEAPGSTATAPEVDCPTVDIRRGTSTYTVSTPGEEPTALNLRYQASFGQTARECKLAGNMLTIKVGVEGRVIVGPAGGPGQIEVPVRYAVVEEGPDPKVIMTKVRWQSVTIPSADVNVPFVQIEDELTFPMPRGNNIEAYVVYVGFDRAIAKEPAKKPVKGPPKTSVKKPPTLRPAG